MQRRPTFEEIQAAAERHVAYRWAKSPGTHDRDIVWTQEDRDTYNKEFDKCLAKRKTE